MADKPLKSLNEHNHAQSLLYQPMMQPQIPRLNGIACPNCGEEMVDDDVNCVRASMPPQIQVRCPKCNHYSFRVVEYEFSKRPIRTSPRRTWYNS